MPPADPKLPPLFTGHAVIAPVRPLDDAGRGAAAGAYGAGDFVWARATEHMRCALVLEPDVSLAIACQMSALAHVAVAETLGHLCPPQIAVQCRWPATILVNGAACGSVVLAVPPTAPDALPPWLVVAIDLTLTPSRADTEPGFRPNETSLADEGAEIACTDLIEALATRLLAWLHTWQEAGFRPIHDDWLFRAEGRDADVVRDGVLGRVLGLDETGSLLFRPTGARHAVVHPMLPHVRSSA